MGVNFTDLGVSFFSLFTATRLLPFSETSQPTPLGGVEQLSTDRKSHFPKSSENHDLLSSDVHLVPFRVLTNSTRTKHEYEELVHAEAQKDYTPD